MTRQTIPMFCITIIVLIFSPFILCAQLPTDLGKVDQLANNPKADTATIGALLKMGESFVEKSNADPSAVSAVFYISEKMEKLSIRLKDSLGIGLSQLLFAKAYRITGKNAEARLASNKSLGLISHFGKPLQKAQALIELGGTYGNSTADLPVKISFYQQAVDIIHEHGDMETEARIKEFLGELLQNNQQFSESLAVLTESLELYNKVGYGRLHGVYSLMAESQSALNNFVESLKYNLLAIQVGERYKDNTPLMEAVYNRVGLNYHKARYYEQAIDYFGKALAVARLRADTPTVKTMLLNTATVLMNAQQYQRSLDSLTRAMTYGDSKREIEKIQIEMLYLRNYIALNQLPKATPHYRKMLEYYRSDAMSLTAKQVMRLAITLYLQAFKRFEETRPFLQEYQLHKNEVSVPLNMLADGELYSFRTDSALGNATSALGHFQAYKILSDSLTSTAQARQMGVLQLQFQTEQKDKNIELLTQKNQLQDASLQREKLLRNIVIAGACMVIFFMMLIYNRYRTKKKAARLLEDKQDEINRQNSKLKRLLDEKEWLLKEIHHRVKNNLQIVISLLNSQSKFLDNKDAKAAIRNSQYRMYAMSLIHQKLYQTDELGTLDMDWYIKELAGYLKDSLNTEGNIRFIIENDPISLEVAQAVPLGLIINEAVSNSIKYAFPGDRKGTIRIELKNTDHGHCTLLIADDGVGAGDAASTSGGKSLGMDLIRGLAVQLNGEFNFNSGVNGVSISLRFPCNTFSEALVAE
ncbi:MAG: histidine kinase [Citrobacter freundii]|nr:MAG: histidine kinase [Citrobacter freundii]